MGGEEVEIVSGDYSFNDVDRKEGEREERNSLR